MRRFASNSAKEFGKRNRKRLTTVEAALWSRLRFLRSDGLVFRRQYAVGNYVADFVHLKSKTAIELIGRSHDDSAESDSVREQFFIEQGWRVLYFRNLEVMNQIDWVVESIINSIRSQD